MAGAGRHPLCAPVFFGVAGSGQGARYPTPSSIPHGISPADARAYGSTVALVKSGLVRFAGRRLAQAHPVPYPAVSWDQYIGLDGLARLDASEHRGAAHLVAQIRSSYRGGCLGRPVLLAGYSQGAEVVVRAVDELAAWQQRTVTVALLGDPSYRPGRRGDYPGHTTAQGLRPAALGARAGLALPRSVLARSIDVCAPGDPICGIPKSVTGLIAQAAWVVDHAAVHGSAYLHGRFAEVAARFLWQHRAR